MTIGKQFLFLILCSFPLVALAQLKRYPIQQPANPEAAFAKTKSLEPMSLPFWDDFSAPASSDTLWSNKATVWINTSMAIDPPTIGVATFDGLNENGTPYSPNPDQTLEVGLTDSLESRRIKMTEVGLFQRNSVFLSFYYQWGGHGETPDANDYLQLEFRNQQGAWEIIRTLRPNRATERFDEFYSVIIRINEDRFYHDDFQFRFRSFGRRSGRFDTWHLDYVYLNRGRTETDLTYPDRAIRKTLSPLFEKYYAVPYKHFKQEKTITPPAYAVYNLSNILTTLSYLTYGTFVNYFDDDSESVFEENLNGTDTSSISLGFGVPPFVNIPVDVEYIPDPDNHDHFDPQAKRVEVSLKIRVFTGDVIDLKTGNPSPGYLPIYEPIDFRANDTIRQHYTLHNYYAYDDGVAEYSAGLTQPGNIVAYRFTMQTSEPDTINGVYVHYPVTSGVSASNTTFYIWGDTNGEPGPLLLEELVPVERKTNNEFILREFIQSARVQGVFYIGWRQPATGRVQVGLDTGNDTGNQIFVNTTGSWIPNTDVKGSLMLRPRFGKGNVVTSSEGRQQPEVSIYPNPNFGEFFMEGEPQGLTILNAGGHPVVFETEQLDNRMRITITYPIRGLYLVRYFNGTAWQTKKIVVQD
ncbi:MAG: T9SS type A sorting domain-containing protein [Cyclobacteriaceae bacterium]|nr:T9SS type A sorting domain-containing protein [Cyclobacteriaceae bacterium]UYN85709.1 MAG: T9SS type A sorting domain-containing protein [Cyclobacteriaceae bacterium]